MKIIKSYMKNLIEQFKDKKIIAQNKEHLKKIIHQEIKRHGNECNLNHINVSKITNFDNLFTTKSIDTTHNNKDFIDLSKFNGDISEWDVSNAKTMHAMFTGSEFNGNISKWNVSHVTNMKLMFAESKFNGDISDWDVSNVIDMTWMFKGAIFNNDISQWNVSNVEKMGSIFHSSNFSKDLSTWKPYKLEESEHIFHEGANNIPYWGKYNSNFLIKKAINSYLLEKELTKELSQDLSKIKNIEKKLKL